MRLSTYLGWFFLERRFVLGFLVFYIISLLLLQKMTTRIDVPRTSRRANHDKGTKRHSAVFVPDKKTVDKSCKDLPAPTFLAHGTLPLTALHSFPGSGNTWTRLLLTSATGIRTGDVYKDKAFKTIPEFSFRSDDTVIAVKTHHPFADDSNGRDPRAPRGHYWERVIILVRHPLDTTIAVFNFGQSKSSHTDKADFSKFIQRDGLPTPKWKKYAHDQIRNWGRCLLYWINVFKGPKIIIFYEDLQSNLKEQLIALNQFLGLDLDAERLRCSLESNTQQTFHRKDHHDKRLLYDTSMLNEVEKVLENVKLLISTNYTHIRPGFRIPPYYAPDQVRENFSVKP